MSLLSGLSASFSERGRQLLARIAPRTTILRADATVAPHLRLRAMAHDLLSGRGEASGVAVATDLLAELAAAPRDERVAFLLALADRFDPDPVALCAAWADYARDGASALPALARAVEAPRQELFRRLNLAPGGTAALVRLRAQLLEERDLRERLAAVDADLVHLLQSWFNRGFLRLEEITWSSPADLLERLIRYEAVHDIGSWSELRARLDPPDRRCFGFFHPAQAGEPLIFVEVALTRALAASIQEVLAADRQPIAAETATTAIFYSISNCQPGLRGISFGHFLIKQVAADLRRLLPELTCFATLSPIPGFRRWLDVADPALAVRVGEAGALDDDALRLPLLRRAIDYFDARDDAGRPIDPVARFHLGNGARLERLNWGGDRSAKGLRQSAGLMVNYVYDLARIEEYHELHAAHGTVTTGEPLRALVAELAASAGRQRKRA